MEIKLAESIEELQGILDLQRQNLKRNVPEEERLEYGFVTLEYDLPFLQRCTNNKNHVIAVDAERVVGYVLVIDPMCKDLMPAGKSMFDVFEALPYRDTVFQETNYIVVGQACVARNHGGKGLLGQMYQFYKATYSEKYTLAMTDISSLNKRSVHAHYKVGFETIHTFYEPDAQDFWEIVVWDWRLPSF